MDGGSTDGTVEFLRAANDPRLKWISEPDSGQSAAINKGLGIADGDIVAWLNSDDLYKPGALAAVVEAFKAQPDTSWLVGGCDLIDKDSRPVRASVTRFKKRRLRCFSFRSLLRMNMISQPAVFWRRHFGQSVGPLDESLHWTMDYDLWLRMARRQRPLILEQVLASFRVHGASKSRGGGRPQFREGYRVACRYADGDPLGKLAHRLNVERIVWAYHAMRLIGK